MLLTKTDFIQYLDCPNSLWLLKNKEEIFNEYKGERSLFLEKLIREGYEVEEYAIKTFPGLQDLERAKPDEIEVSLSTPGSYSQVTLSIEDRLFARLDVIEVHDDLSISIYEIKSSTKVKTDPKHNHIKDICFQKYVTEQSGYKVRDVFHVHLNKDFVKDGEIEPFELIEKEEVNDLVAESYDQTISEIQSALTLINKKVINEDLCTCLEKTRSNHCDTFKYFNKEVPLQSIYDLQRISRKKILEFQDMAILKIEDIPDDFKLSDYQSLQRQAVLDDDALIERVGISSKLSKLIFPLYFFDYETLPNAVPQVDGYGPHGQVPIQYSLHILDANGDIEHVEYLSENLESPEKLLSHMREHIGSTGTLVSWYASFEKSRNKEMSELYPEYSDFLHDINARTFDLMDVFKNDYVDAKFEGSNSIKKVQPILVPDLSYKQLEVQSGTMAVDSAERLYKMTDLGQIESLRKSMLEYCKMDTLAMVEIYKKLKQI